MNADHYNVLFLCTGNSARSIMAEAILNHIAPDNFRGYSAGSMPKGEVQPMALQMLQRMGLPIEHLHSKAWDEFAAPGAPQLHFVFTLCDRAAAEPCPVWPGQPITAHWGTQDPAAAVGEDAERLRVFRRAFLEIETRLRLFTSLPLDKIDRLRLKQELQRIGRTRAETTTED